MTLSPLHPVVNWPVFTIYNLYPQGIMTPCMSADFNRLISLLSRAMHGGPGRAGPGPNILRLPRPAQDTLCATLCY